MPCNSRVSTNTDPEAEMESETLADRKDDAASAVEASDAAHSPPSQQQQEVVDVDAEDSNSTEEEGDFVDIDDAASDPQEHNQQESANKDADAGDQTQNEAAADSGGDDDVGEGEQSGADNSSAVDAVVELNAVEEQTTAEGKEHAGEGAEHESNDEEGDRLHNHEAGHSTDEYDPADPDFGQTAYDPADLSSTYERHGSGEYDPANPSASPSAHEHGEYDPANPDNHGDDEYDPANPSYNQEEYDPSNPSYGGEEYPSAENDTERNLEDAQSPPMQQPVSGLVGVPNPTTKRKSLPSESEMSQTEQPSQPERDLKRPRGGSASSHDDARPPASKTAKPRHDDGRKEDKKGLSDAAWDRLKDFQSGGEDFQMTQVSRAAFASVGSLPDFAQVAIVARFTRVQMKEIRDKNGQLMRIYHEYLKENPHIASLQPVSVYIADYKSDPGLFEYGYAPPFPVYGISSVPVPYQKEDPSVKARAPAAVSAPTSHSVHHPVAARSDPGTKPSTTDEFGRVMNQSNSPSQQSVSETSERPSHATDPRRAAVGAPPPQQQPPGRSDAVLSAGKPLDPRRRQTESHIAGESEFVPAQDPRRPANSVSSVGGHPPGDPRRRSAVSGQALRQVSMANNELFNRLPRSVQIVLENMITEGRLYEAINDNVLSRLSHLPEHVALRAVENFSNVDLTQIDNLQGFLVGIINRVNEKAIAAEQNDSHGPPARGNAVPAAIAPSLSAYAHGGGDALLAFPTGEPLLNGAQQSGFRDRSDPRVPSPAQSTGGYDRQYDASSAESGRSNPHQHQGMSALTAAPAAMSSSPALLAKSPGHQKAIGALPLSVQSHLQSMAANGVMSSIDEFGEKCYEVLGQLSEALANEVLTRFTNANLTTVRNRSGFLIGVVKRCRQEYGFN